MLYQIGAITLDTYPFEVSDVDRNASADFAVKPVISGMKPREFMGEGDDEFTLSGQLLPSRIGGLTELEALHGFRAAGQRLPVMRGDGRMLGWFAITGIREKHGDPERNGVGFTLGHTITMIKVGPEGASPAILGTLLSLFGVLQ